MQENNATRLEEVKAEIRSIHKELASLENQIEECKQTIKIEKQAVENATEAGMTDDAATLSQAVKSLESAKRKMNKNKKEQQEKLEELKIEYRALVVTVAEEWLTALDQPQSEQSQSNANISASNGAVSNDAITGNVNPSNATSTSASLGSSAIDKSPASLTGMPAYDSVLALEKTLSAFNAYITSADQSYESAKQTAVLLNEEIAPTPVDNLTEIAKLTKKYTVGEYSSTVNEELKALKEKLNK